MAGLSLARQSGVGALDTIYAEDGSIFLASAYSQSTVDSIFTPYAGYLHLVPRLLSELVSVLPVSAAAEGLAIAAALTTGLLALLVFVASSSYLSSLPARLLVSAVVVLVPVGQEELPNSIANLHWPALYALFWVLLWKPTSRIGRIVAVSAVLLITLSDLLAMVFVPLALWLWWRRRSSHSLTLALALVAGLAAQAAVVVFGPSSRELQPEPVMWGPWYVIRAVPLSVLGQRLLPSDVDSRWLALAAVAWIILAAFVVVGLRNLWRSPSSFRAATAPSASGSLAPASSTAPFMSAAAPVPSSAGAMPGSAAAERPRVTRERGLALAQNLPAGWRLAVLAAAYSIAVYALPVALSGQATPRYAAAPAMLLVTALAALLLADSAGAASVGAASSGRAGWWARLSKPGVGLLAFCAVIWAVNLRMPNERGDGPLWSEEVPRACANGSEVAISPPGWKVQVPCPR